MVATTAGGSGGPVASGPKIVFDPAAAQAAADALRRLAASLNASADLFGRQLPVVTEGWLGRFRDVFDQEASGYLTEAGAFAQGLLQFAVAITAAAEEATLHNNALAQAQALGAPPAPRGGGPV